MARALSTNTTLKRLDLQESTLFGENEWISIFQCFQRPGSELESLCLSDAANVPAALFNALSSNRTLKYIDLSFIEGITTNQWMSLATSLNNMPLEKLRLHGNQENDGGEEIEASTINGEVVASFATLLSNSSSLNTLDFGGNHDVGDGVVSTFAAALTKNRTLSILALDQVYTIEEDDYSDIITNMGWDAITLALCDGSSIDATFNSNHVLEKVWGEWERRQQNRLPKDLFDLLQLNASDMSKFDVARKKILKTHFHKQTKSDEDFSIVDEVSLSLEQGNLNKRICKLTSNTHSYVFLRFISIDSLILFTSPR